MFRFLLPLALALLALAAVASSHGHGHGSSSSRVRPSRPHPASASQPSVDCGRGLTRRVRYVKRCNARMTFKGSKDHPEDGEPSCKVFPEAGCIPKKPRRKQPSHPAPAPAPHPTQTRPHKASSSGGGGYGSSGKPTSKPKKSSSPYAPKKKSYSSYGEANYVSEQKSTYHSSNSYSTPSPSSYEEEEEEEDGYGSQDSNAGGYSYAGEKDYGYSSASDGNTYKYGGYGGPSTSSVVAKLVYDSTYSGSEKLVAPEGTSSYRSGEYEYTVL